ncbi:hypothetical protein OIY81_1035 [Cryptosporidium canis]|uniref:protein disulfide-isomerase n=1 Tax=Cryptosporidium canis TaxID=195482 RepID=A0ABQ8PBW1_9CRYT|nr:hypothetical protein OIY81_1035 [Cryptosporidium canis]KAJ1615335.1 hypothetical protein OJ252_206 [Cryptosporidium canis]
MRLYFATIAIFIYAILSFSSLSIGNVRAIKAGGMLNESSGGNIYNLEQVGSNKDGIRESIPLQRSHLAPVNGVEVEQNTIRNDTASSNFTKKSIEIVTIKTDESFEGLLSSHEYLLILFIAPWCGMSKRAVSQIHEMIEYFEKSRDFLVEHPNQLFYSKKLLVSFVNVPEFPNITKRLNVLDYPSIKLVNKGENLKLRVMDFYGNIYHKKVLSWIIQQVTRLENNPASQLIHLSTMDNIQFFLEISEYSVVYLHGLGSGSKYNNTEFLQIVDICKVYDDIIFGEANYSELNNSLKMDPKQIEGFEPSLNITELITDDGNKSKLLLFNSGRHVKTIQGPFTEEALVLNAIDYYKQENIIFLNKDTIGKLIDNGGPILLLMFNGNSENYIDELNKESSIIYQFYGILQRVISIRKEKIDQANIHLEERPLFVMCGNEGPINRRFMDFLHIDDDLLPSIIMIDDLNVSPPKKFHLDLPKIYLSNLESNVESGTGVMTNAGIIGNIDRNSEILSIGKPNESNWIVLNNHTSINFSPSIISDFIDEVRSGMVNITYHSQAVPAKQNGPVYILVGNTFKEVVHDANKDVLVLFYTPWCGHCKTFDPIYNEVANIITSKTNVLVAKIDMSANFIPDDQIGGKIFRFPTIKLFKKKDKQNPIDFDGEREVNSILDFIWIHTARDEL